MDQKIFNKLINITKKTVKSKDIPVSALIVDSNGKIISIGWNTRNKNNKISGHAEINAINNAFKKLKLNNLENYKMITTLEPCSMCFGAIIQSKISFVEFILENKKIGINSVYSINELNFDIRKTSTKQQENEYQNLIKNFFKIIR